MNISCRGLSLGRLDSLLAKTHIRWDLNENDVQRSIERERESPC